MVSHPFLGEGGPKGREKYQSVTGTKGRGNRGRVSQGEVAYQSVTGTKKRWAQRKEGVQAGGP